MSAIADDGRIGDVGVGAQPDDRRAGVRPSRSDRLVLGVGAGARPDDRGAGVRPSRWDRLVLGVGMSSKATAEEVRDLVRQVVGQAHVDLDAIALVATRDRFVADDRVRLGPPVAGVADATLLDRYPAPERTVGRGFAARVAEGCAMAAAGESAELLVGTTRSAHATAALAAGTVR
jgi:hypothetical protein